MAFHAGLTARDHEGAKNIRGRVLACCGADDPLVPPEQRAAFEAEMRAGAVDWQLHVYGGAAGRLGGLQPTEARVFSIDIVNRSKIG